MGQEFVGERDGGHLDRQLRPVLGRSRGVASRGCALV